MKSLVLKPTYENLLDSLKKDSIGRNTDIGMFADIINSITDSCSISLDGSWGSGKTFFVKQTKMLLDAHNDDTNFIDVNDRNDITSACKVNPNICFKKHVTVYYDAWENDNEEEPVLSLVYSIVSSINSDFAFSDNKTLLQQAASILNFFTGKDWKGVIESFESGSPFD